MSIFIVFPGQMQPTTDEEQLLNKHLSVLGGFRPGYMAHTKQLALEFDEHKFRSVQSRFVNFGKLIDEWRERGCKVVDHLQFQPNEKALQPVDVDEIEVREETSHEKVARLRAQAAEAEGLSKLRTHSTVEGIDRFAGWSKYVPHALVIGTGTLVITAGITLYNEVKNSRLRPRREVIEDFSKDGMGADPNHIFKKKAGEAEDPAAEKESGFVEKENEKKETKKAAQGR